MSTVLTLGLVAGLQAAAPEVPSLQVAVPSVAGATADPTCGGRQPLSAIATCFATRQAAVDAVVDAWNVDFAAQGWLPADGRENRIVYVKRRPEGGCDAFQLLAFASDDAVAAPDAPAFLALAAVPGDVCAPAATEPTP